ncbi:MAG: sigma-70 family RNA polymerase sigma factor [Bacteroidia bacterium]|nr:sigma-70 family RNA polymerase sigma factor [Bacteroidia bacterium]
MIDLSTLINKCRNKDIRAEYELYRYCFGILIGICNRYTINKDDSVDLLNRAFLKILNNLKKYDDTKSFEKWSKSIMVNTIIDEFRKSKNYRALFVENELKETISTVKGFDMNEGMERLNAADMMKEIKRLPEGCKEVFNLYVFEGLSHNEISKSLSIAESTSRWHLLNARNLLKIKFARIVESLKVMIL